MSETDMDRPKPRLLIADDEESMRFYLKRALGRRGFETRLASDGEQAISLYEQRRFDLVICDLKMPGADGIEALKKIRELDPDAGVIIMTAYGTVKSAVMAMKLGAQEYITKPFEIDELMVLIEKALKQKAFAQENRDLKTMVDHRSSYCGMIGQSPGIRAVYQTIDMLKGSSATVLIVGESGTGKELVARAIHINSTRFDGAFVPMNCANIPEHLLENELFGHDTGAFTGAHKDKRGLVETAENGAVFFDEVSELSLSAQVKLLRFLQEREYKPLGAEAPVKINLRVIAASNRDLEAAVKKGEFRQDLFWRLNVVPIRIPPLRERKEDIPMLVSAFLKQHVSALNCQAKEFTMKAMIAITSYPWPGNVRELQNFIEQMVVLNADKELIDLSDLPDRIRSHDNKTLLGKLDPENLNPFQEALRAFETEYLTLLFKRTEGNVSKAAQLAGISRQNLHRKIKLLDLDPVQFRP